MNIWDRLNQNTSLLDGEKLVDKKEDTETLDDTKATPVEDQQEELKSPEEVMDEAENIPQQPSMEKPVDAAKTGDIDTIQKSLGTNVEKLKKAEKEAPKQPVEVKEEDLSSPESMLKKYNELKAEFNKKNEKAKWMDAVVGIANMLAKQSGAPTVESPSSQAAVQNEYKTKLDSIQNLYKQFQAAKPKVKDKKSQFELKGVLYDRDPKTGALVEVPGQKKEQTDVDPLYDPNSPESRAFQQSLINSGVDPERVKGMPAKLGERVGRSLMSKDIKSQSQLFREREDVESDVERLRKNVSPALEAIDSIKLLEETIQEYVPKFSFDDDKAHKQNIPGVSIPGIGRTTFFSGKARDVRSAFDSVFNKMLKQRSGAAVTDPELNRLEKEFGAGKFDTEENMIKAVKRIKKAYNLLAKKQLAGIDEEARTRFEKDTGYSTSSFLNKEKSEKSTDPKIEEYAKKYKINYEKAEKILRSRGYGRK